MILIKLNLIFVLRWWHLSSLKNEIKPKESSRRALVTFTLSQVFIDFSQFTHTLFPLTITCQLKQALAYPTHIHRTHLSCTATLFLKAKSHWPGTLDSESSQTLQTLMLHNVFLLHKYLFQIRCWEGRDMKNKCSGYEFTELTTR